MMMMMIDTLLGPRDKAILIWQDPAPLLLILGRRDQEEAVMVGVAPQFTQRSPLFFVSCNGRSCVIGQSRPILPRVPRKWSSMVQHGPAKSGKFQHVPACSSNGPANSRNVPHAGRAGPCWTMIYFDWPWDPRPPASSSTMAVFIDDRPLESQRIHHRRPSARVWGSAVMYSRCSTTSPQRFVWRKVARGSSCFVVTGREESSRTIRIAPRINKFDRIKLILHYK
jgi:hypothetical protein